MIRQHKVGNKQEWIPSAMPLFSLGVVYYMILPAFAISLLSEDNDLLFAATKYLESSYFDFSYYLDAIFIFASFWLGYSLGKVGTSAKSSVLDYGSFQTSFPSLLALLFFMLIMYFVLTAVSSGANLFTGYSTYNILVLGPLSTSVFMSAWFINYFTNRKIFFLFFSFFVFCSVLLLGWGSRMFFLLGILAVIFGLVSKNKKLLRDLRLYGLVIGLFLFMVVVGVVREGGAGLSSDKIIGIFVAEPLFTAITGALYLENVGERPVYGVPNDLYASVIHFIPSFIYPQKIELLKEITFNENARSPFGAKALIVNLYSNFGFFYPIFIAFIGFYYGFLRKKAQNSVFFRATYFSALPILVLLFFRDNLATVIKVMYFNGLLVPFFVSLILIWLSPRTLADIRREVFYSSVKGELKLRNHDMVTPRSRRF